jgi:hypothetical protein
MRWYERLERIDRRWLFLAVALVVLIPMILELKMAPEPSPAAKKVYDAVEALPEGAVVLVSADYDPGSEAELYPMNVALFHHLARKNVRVILTVLWPQGRPLAEKALAAAYYPHGKEYGRDIVNLGYKTGGQVLISKMVQSISDAYPTDVHGTPLSQVPAMRGVRSLKDVDFFFILSAGTPGTQEWVQVCQAQTSKPMVSGVTAVSAPDFFAYVDNDQLLGLLGGLRGASDYERLVGIPGRGMTGMGSQTFGHLLIVAFVILGNVGYFLNRRGRRA